jgi:serine/threonine protein kinase
VKELRSSNREEFDYEIHALQMLPPHNHLTGLLSSYQYRDSYFLIFPWASGGNLYDLWKSSSTPPLLSPHLLAWVTRQCLGIAEALRAIHTAPITSSGPSRALEETVLFGRHGDIKPSNILWFPDVKEGKSSNDEKYVGVLRLSDFGLTRFHRADSRSMVAAKEIGWSLTYRAPETDLHTVSSRAYDIWSLGCVYLEFLTWLVLGWTGVDDFSIQRVEESSATLIKEDTYFEVKRGKRGQQPEVVVKKSVQKVRNGLFKPMEVQVTIG